MFKPEAITLDDITSDLHSGKAHLKKAEVYSKEYQNYTPDADKMEIIEHWLQKHHEKLLIRAFGASWCGDCKIQIPRLIKITHLLGEDFANIQIGKEIKVKPPYDRKEGEFIWKSPPSPPETIDPRFDMRHIPAIFLFLKDGTCIGKIDEKPNHTPSLEGDIIYYFEKA